MNIFSLTTIWTVFIRCFLTGGLAGLLFGCSVINLDDHPDLSSRKILEAVDKVQTDLEKDLQKQVPSLNVYIQTPTQTYFTSSVAKVRSPSSDCSSTAPVCSM